MAKQQKKRSILARFRNYFITGIVVLIPIGITVYLTVFIVKISSPFFNPSALAGALTGIKS